MTDLATEIKSYAERVYGGLAKKVKAFIAEAEVVVVDDVEILYPYVLAAVSALFSQVGQAAVKAEVAALPAIGVEAASGQIGTALVTAGTAAAAAITSAVNADALADVNTEVNDAEANGVTAESLVTPPAV